MQEDYIYQNIYELNTPIGKISVTNIDIQIPFHIRQNKFNPEYTFYDINNKTVLHHLSTCTNYQLCIPVSNLKIGALYSIHFYGGSLHYNAGDEHIISLTNNFNNYAIGIGAYDPNDDLKCSQSYSYSKKNGFLQRNIIQEPSVYDEKCFYQYTLDVLDDFSGFSFKLLDHSIDHIFFNVAWIKMQSYDYDEYESAVDFWIS